MLRRLVHVLGRAAAACWPLLDVRLPLQSVGARKFRPLGTWSANETIKQASPARENPSPWRCVRGLQSTDDASQATREGSAIRATVSATPASGTFGLWGEEIFANQQGQNRRASDLGTSF